jgi:hypothetical protein
MRQVTATEKYRAVNEGKLSKGVFVTDMRMAHPSIISQWNSYDDTVQILKNKGFISEKSGVDTYDSRYELNISPDSIDRGVRYELQALGHDPATCNDKEAQEKSKERAIKNLKKDPLHYILLVSKESSHVDKNDKPKEVKRGAADKDTFNDLKKATLKEGYTEEQINTAIQRLKEKKEAEKRELPQSFKDKEKDQIEKDAMKAKGMIKEDPRENIIAVAKVIRDKYGDIPGFTSILKDFLFTHQNEIKSGEVKPEDAIAEFDNYIDANYDRLDEKEVEVNEYRGSGDEIKAIIRDRAADSGFSEQEEAQEVMEFIGQEYEIDFEFGAGPSRMAEKKGKDHDGDGDVDGDDYMAAKDKAIKKAMGKNVDELNISKSKMDKLHKDGEVEIDGEKITAKDEVVKESIKAIIQKVLEEGTINEAATNELARLADEYAGFDGMKSSILDLQNIVTDIESFYDKTRDKIQKVYDSIGEIRNEEGLKVGGFLAPAIESAFNRDLRPISKQGFTKGLDTPKVRTLSQADIDAARAAGDIEEEPKQTMFTPINEKK